MDERNRILRRARQGRWADEMHFLKIGAVVGIVLMVTLPLLFAAMEAAPQIGGWP